MTDGTECPGHRAGALLLRSADRLLPRWLLQHHTDDVGTHVICARVTADFLAFSLKRGNDLSTPRPEHRFRGLVAGDRWCLSVLRWKEAWQARVAPPVVLECTHERALDHVMLETLQSFDHKALG